ncbi:MAG TPA: Uma2 family endonuclease, partial [Gemmataceae bacterium]|nr:Uma2 family endonuclease [Gemmataceae bacterium]
EFERRYAAMPPSVKAELIEGVVYVASPVRIRRHGSPHPELVSWTGVYQVYTPGVLAGGNATVRLDNDNEPQPDVSMLIEKGGQARVDEDDYIEGAPEFVAEVAASTVSYDLNDKLKSYRRNGVREYLVWRVLDEAIDWFALREGKYESLPAGMDAITRSEVFPGLWLDAAALLRGDLARVHDVLHKGLASPEHAEFVARLQKSNP